MLLSRWSIRSLCNSLPLLRNSISLASTSKSDVQRLPVGYSKVPPFGLYVKANYVKKEGEKATESMIRLRNEWASLSTEEKQKYTALSVAQAKEKAAKFSALSVMEQQRLLDESKKMVEERRARKSLQQKPRESGAQSHRPLTAYNLYIRDALLKAGKGAREVRNTVLKEAAVTWKSMSDAQKQKFVDEAASFPKTAANEKKPLKEDNGRPAEST